MGGNEFSFYKKTTGVESGDMKMAYNTSEDCETPYGKNGMFQLPAT